LAIDQAYFHHVRSDIEPLLPAHALRILDVGAGAGQTSAWLRGRYPGVHIIGLEGNPAMLEQLRKNVDEPHIVDLNGPIPDVGAPDLILCLDVLEHLVQPEIVVAHLVRAMAFGGTVIISCPNVAHFSVSIPLLLRGTFEYSDAGILDRTHLRFFVRKSMVALMNQAGLMVRSGIRIGLEGPRTRLVDRLSAGMARDHLTKQYILAGERSDPGAEQGPIEWRTGVGRPGR
jgi:2-polyprenyl-3-methyl-5-hydroxy-6-metoxy-1,4-benzoquinol methylase